MIEDALLRHDNARHTKILTLARRLRELRLKLEKAQTPEEIAAVSEELKEVEQQFFSSTGTVVKTDD